MTVMTILITNNFHRLGAQTDGDEGSRTDADEDSVVVQGPLKIRKQSIDT